MSKHLVTLIYGKVCGSAMRKAVLVAMADRANDDGSGVYVSKSRIAAELECSRTTVQSATRELEEDGILHAVGKKTGNHGYTTIYQISVRNLSLLPDAWVKCTDSSTLDSGLGEDVDDEIQPTNGTALKQSQVPKSTGSSANLFGKNRPYRTIDNNSNSKKTDAPRPKSLSDQADLLLWEARRVRASGDHERAVEMEQQASDLLAQDSEIKTKTEH